MNFCKNKSTIRKLLFFSVAVLLLSLSGCGKTEKPKDEDSPMESHLDDDDWDNDNPREDEIPEDEDSKEKSHKKEKDEELEKMVGFFLGGNSEGRLYRISSEDEMSDKDIDAFIYCIQQRCEAYSSEAAVIREGEDGIRIIIPGISEDDEDFVYETVTASWSLEFKNVDDEIILTQNDIENAEVDTFEDATGNKEFVIRIKFNPMGTEIFAEETGKSAPNRDPIYIIADGIIISAPVVNEAITGGEAVISGNFTYENALSIAGMIQACKKDVALSLWE